MLHRVRRARKAGVFLNADNLRQQRASRKHKSTPTSGRGALDSADSWAQSFEPRGLLTDGYWGR